MTTVLLAAVLGVAGARQLPAQDVAGPAEVVCLRPQFGGYYTELAYLLAEHLEAELEDGYRVSVTDEPAGRSALTGAMDLISTIADLGVTEERYYIGLTQADVAYYFSEGGHSLYPTSHVHRDNVVALGWAFPEYLYIYSANPELCEAKAGFADHARSWQRLYLGDLGSGTLITSTNVLSLLAETAALVGRAEPGRVHQEFLPSEESPGAAGRAAMRAEAWGGATVDGASSEDVQGRLTRGEGCLIGLSDSQARHMANIYSRFYRIGVPSYRDREGGVIDVEAIEVPALLVASKQLPREPAEAVIGFLDRLDGRAAFGSDELPLSTGEDFLRELAGRLGDPQLVDEARVPNLYEALNRARGDRRGDLVLRTHRSMAGIRPPGLGWVFWIAAASLAATLWLGADVLKQWRQHGFFEVPLKLMLPTVALAAVFWTHGCVWLVQLLDYEHFMTYRTDALTPFLTETYPDLLPRLIHHVATAFTSSDLFPVRRSAQLVWLTIPLVILGNMLWGATRLVVPHATAWLKKHFKGGSTMQLDNHTVIINWHGHTEDVVRELYTQAEIAGRTDREIVVVTGDDGQVSLPRMMTVNDDEQVGEHFVHGIALSDRGNEGGFAGLKPVYVFAGDAAKPATLKRVKVEKAEVVIVFPNMALDDPDGPTAITVLNIRRRISSLHGGSGDGGDGDEQLGRPRVVVWCADPDNVPVFLDESFGLDDVCSAEWAWRVICQAASVRHVSNIYRRLMTTTANTNEFYELELPDEWRQCCFHEIQESLRNFNLEHTEVLPGRERQKNTVMLIAYSEREDRRRERIRINPNPDLLVSAGDTLFVLTYTCDLRRRRKIMDHLLRDNRASAADR